MTLAYTSQPVITAGAKAVWEESGIIAMFLSVSVCGRSLASWPSILVSEIFGYIVVKEN